MYKRFPLNKISNSKQFYLQYISEKNDLLQNIDFIEVDEILIEIKKCIKRSNIIYSCGNGGSISLTSNFSLISAISNDISFDEIFSFQVKKLCKKNDILILFSVSGNSKNLINAVKIAKKKKVKTISFTGFDGGKLSKLSDFNINFPMANYGIVEDCHVTMMHYISQYLRNTAIKSRNFKKINF